MIIDFSLENIASGIGFVVCMLIVLCVGVWMGCREEKKKRPPVIGTLKVATDEDGTDYMFLEVDKGKLATIKSSDKILLRVKQVTDE